MKCLTPFQCGHTPFGCFEAIECSGCAERSTSEQSAREVCECCGALLTADERSNYKDHELRRECDKCFDAREEEALLDEAHAEWLAESAEEDSL